MKRHLLLALLIITTSLCRAQQTPILWGMTNDGGQEDRGIIFSLNVATDIETNVHSFIQSGTDGYRPTGSFIQANNGLLYGMAGNGGTYNKGGIISYDISTGKESLVYSFAGGTDGENPAGSLLPVNDSLLYGMTPQGGTNGFSDGVLFKYNILTGVETVVHDFGNGNDGNGPNGSLIQVNDSLLYGMASFGGTNNDGTIFSYNIRTEKETIVYNFGGMAYGASPFGSLLLANNGLLYGMTENGGVNYGGNIFSYSISKGTYTDVHDFNSGTDGRAPNGSLIQAKDNLIYGITSQGGLYSYGMMFSYNVSTNAETDIHDFGAGYDGELPYGSLIQSSNDLLYGMTNEGGDYLLGMVFSYDISTGIETDIHDFSGPASDGSYPYGDLFEIDSITIFVTPVTSTICAGNSDTLKATGATTYTWIPATGLNVTTGDSVIANPTVTTTYTVTGATGPQTSTKTVTVTVTSPPVVTINTPSPICYGGSTKLTAGGAAEYTWSPSAGLSATVGASVTADPTITTTYTVTGTVVGGCSSTNTVTVTVNPTPTITASPNPFTYCPGGNSILTASGGNTYSWTPSTALSATTGSSVIANPTVTTTYTVTGENTYGCPATSTVTVSVLPSPTITASADPASYCPGGSSTLTASGGDSYTWEPPTNLSDITGTIVTANPTATTIYTVTGISSSGGCSAKTTVTVTVNPTPTITASPSLASICLGDKSTLTASGGDTYTWTPSTGLSATSGSSVIANPTTTTTYTVTGTSAAGCSATNTVAVTVNPNPTITASPSPASYCPGGSSTLSASGGITYTWAPSTALSATTGSSVTANPTLTTIYTVTGINTYGCPATNTVTVTANPYPKITTYASPYSYCPGLSSTLSSYGGTTYTWTPSTDLSATTGNTVTTMVTATTTYTVTGTDANGCVNTATVTVTVGINPVITASASPSSYCEGGSDTLTAIGGLTYTWAPATGLSATTGDTITANPTITTTYTISGTSGTDCAATTTVTITVNPLPVLTVTREAVICKGGITPLTASGASTYTWTPTTGLNATTGDSVMAAPTVTTTYVVIGTSALGCTTTGSEVVTVLPPTTPPTFYQDGDTLISSSANDNQWYRNDTLLIGDTSRDLIITSIGEYLLTVGNEANGCNSESDSMKITQVTGVNQLTVESGQVTVYPNPFASTVFIKINSSALDVSDWNLMVTDVLGRSLYSTPLNPLKGTCEIDLSNLTSGMYFITVISKTERDVVPVVKQ